MFQRTLAYPLALLVLLVLTGTAVLIVVLNTLQLLVGIKALPLSSPPAILGEAQQGKVCIDSGVGGFSPVSLSCLCLPHLHSTCPPLLRIAFPSVIYFLIIIPE